MRTLIASFTVLLLASVASAQQPSVKAEHRLPIAAPGDAAALPEGIDVDERTGTYFTGATSDGTIYRGALDAPVAEVFLPAGADGRLVAQGIEIDDERRLLFVATGPQGTVDAYDIDSRRLVGQYSSGLGGYANDIAVTPAGDVYFTDSLRPNLYRVRAADVRGRVSAQAIPIPQDGPFSYSVAGDGRAQPNAVFNAGGVDALDDRTLLVTQINEGRLFRFEVDPAAAEAQIVEVPIEGAADNLDALELAPGSRAFVTDNIADEILTLQLGPDAATARVVQRTSEPNLCTPTAVGLVEGADRVVVANSQLFRLSGVPFTISSLPLPLDGTVEDNPDRGRSLTPCERDLDGLEPVPSPTGPGPAPGSGDAADNRARRAPAVSVSRARLRDGVLSLRAALTRRAAGERVRIAVRAGGREVSVGSRPRRRTSGSRAPIRLTRRLTGDSRTARLRLRYDGNKVVRPFAVTLTAARRGAALTSRRPFVRNGRLRARGRLNRRARGPVRLRIAFRAAGRTRTFDATTPARRGRFALNRRLPDGVRALLAARDGPIRAYVLYSGAPRRAIAGELEAFTVR